MNTVKLAKQIKNHGYPVYRFHLPSEIGRKLDHLVGSSFSAELTDEGILYRLVLKTHDTKDATPDWAKE